MACPLHQLAAHAGGVLLVRDALAIGYAWPDLRRILTSEGWTRIARGAYLMPGRQVDLVARLRAQQLLRPQLIASHRAAAMVLGFEAVTPQLEMTAPPGTRCDLPGGRLYRAEVPTADVVDIEGLRCTAAVRTAIDLCRALPRHPAVIVLDSALRLNAVTLDAIAAGLELVAGRPGSRRAWAAFRHADPKSGSVTESKARLLMVDAGLHPCTQQIVVDPLGGNRVVRVDFQFGRLIVEVEGAEVHGGPAGHQYDVNRFNAVSRLRGDLVVLRFTWADVFHRPKTFIATIVATLRAMDRAAAASAGGPL